MSVPLFAPSDIETQALLEDLTSVGAPTFQEEARAEFVFQWLKSACGEGVGRDGLGNVWVDLSGGRESVCLFDAHLDTVFPDSSVAVRKDGRRWHAPGIFDNTVACVQLMLWARDTVVQNRRRPFLAVFTVGEEGAGDLRGIRAIIERFRSRLRSAVVFDLDLGDCSRKAVGSIRYRMRWSGPGGHSWNDFGAPSAIHRAAAWIARLPELFPWRPGANSFNIGGIEGGSGVNVIADSATATLDIRSVDDRFLATFAAWIEAPSPGSDAPDTITPTGSRPAGEIPLDHPLIGILRGIHRDLEIDGTERILSTNGNALLAAGIPTLVTGLASGGNIHRADEYLDLPSLAPGRAKLTALADRWEPFL